MTTVHFVRHGDVYDPDGIYYGRLPGYRLSDNGIECIRYTANQLKRYPVAAIFHSPLLRAEQSAQILNEHFNVPLIPDERLIELGTHFEGKSRELLLKYPPTSKDYAETMEQIYARMAASLRDMLKQYPESHVVAVGHGGPIRILEMGLLNQPFTDDGYAIDGVPVCGSDTVIRCEGDQFTVERSQL